MALQGDGNGVVTIPNFQSFGVFSITGKAVYKDGLQMILGFNGGGTTYLSCFASGVVRAVTSGTAVTLSLSGFTEGDVLNYSWSRDAANLVTLTINGTATTGTIAGAMSIDSLGQFNGGQFKYNGEWQDTLIMTGDVSGNDRSYDFNQPNGSLVLPDATSSQDGTLSEFTSGGFTGGGGGNTISITSVVDYQCKQRDDNGDAVFTISGPVVGATTVEYSTDNSTWMVLDAAPTATFTGNVTINGQKTVYVRLSNDTGIADQVTALSAALCVPCWWQSNMAGRLTNNQTVTPIGSNPVPVSYKSGAYSVMTDPTGTDGSSTGSLLPLIAQYYSDLGIPVCFANVAVGGTSINMWDTSGGNYGNITSFFNDVGGFEFSLSIGGETDSINGMPQAEMETKLGNLVDSINTDFGISHYLVYFPIGDNIPQGQADVIRLAFDSVVTSNANCLFGGDLSVIDIDIATNPENDGIHIKTDADAITATNIIINAINSITSTLNLTATGLPDGSYSAQFWNDDVNPMERLKVESVTFTNSQSQTSIPLGVGSNIYTRIDTLTPLVTGVTCIGVTE